MTMAKNIFVCPECGALLEYAYDLEDGTQVYYCPEGDEEYAFYTQGEYRYARCLWDGKTFCVGVAK